jgi:tetratricopeptide (TPR) repeat protein
MDNPKIALAMIVAPTDEEALLLDRCLGGIVSDEQLLEEHKKINISQTDGLADHVDGIYITVAGKEPEKHELSRKIAEKYGAKVSYFEWNKSFADARNFNFSQVPKEFDYIIWTDTDDVWKNPHMIKPLAKRMHEEAIDVVNLTYNYHYDEFGRLDTQHPKSRLIKNDGCVRWNDSELHEDFEPQRQITTDFNGEIIVLHLTDNSRLIRAMKRNTEISEEAFKKHPNDPRVYWNLANCYLSEGRYEDAIPLYLDFLELSNSEEERFTAWHRLALAYVNMGDNARAMQAELESLALRPWYPDAYFGLGGIYMKMGKYRAAKEMLETGFTKDVSTNEKIAWNPRDYDYTPRMLLAEAYLSLFKPRESVKQLKLALKVCPESKKVKKLIRSLAPEIKKFDFADDIYKKAQKITDKEELRKLLDSVPPEMRYYPAIVSLRNRHFVKTQSSGKDVVIYCSYTAHEWDPNVFKTKGVGGSEEAIVQLAKRWASNGWNVSVYANIGSDEKLIDGVKWIPFPAWNYKDKQDVTILWRHPKPLDYDINSDIILVDMHDVIPKNEFTPERIAKVTKVMFKSLVHRQFCDNVPDDKAIIIPHGLDVQKFEARRKDIKRNPYKLINTSSPDRGLLTNMEIVERVYEKLPEDIKPKLKFRWNYGFRIWDGAFAQDAKMIEWKKTALSKMNKLKKMGIMEWESGDMISQEDIIDQYLESGLLLYPSEFFEIGFISGIKAILAGAIPVTTDVFAQGEFLKEGIIGHSNKNFNNWSVEIGDGIDFGVQTEEQKEFFINEIVKYLTNPEKFEQMRERLIAYAKETFDWDKTALAWEKVFNG